MLNQRIALALLLIGGPACRTTCSKPTESEGSKATMKPTTLALPGADPYPEALVTRLAAALGAQDKHYVPRTHHHAEDGTPKYTNRLILETSPYLLQHAHNPVNWFAWGDEAFAVAQKLGRPVLLSVGYSTCHWCHVMERESFEDEEIAAYINQHFVAIKVDREERPDVDSVYMTAVQLMTGRGGWPMTVVMLPDRTPFFGGTYFPARDGDRGAQIGFLTILGRLSDAYQNDREKIVQTAKRLAEAIAKTGEHQAAEGVPGPEALISAASHLANRYDPVHGGFGRAPKFPRPSTYELLLRYWRRTNDPGALRIVTHSLTKMKNGGIYDHVGGGFARYSTDQRWLVPHFEKMLYDNAQLASLYIETYQASGEDEYARVARDTLDYVLLEMTSPEGGFYSATDADSEGEEGKFFVWTPQQIEAVVGADRAKVVAAYYGVTAAGNFEGHNIFEVTRPAADVAKELAMSEADLTTELAAIRKLLYAKRKTRIHPILDDKILTEWNGQMISALARAGFALNEQKYVAAAERAAEFVLTKLTQKDRLLRAYRAGQAKHLGVLEDYAFFIAGLIDVYEATGKVHYIERAIALQKRQDELFSDPNGGAYFGTATDGEKLLVREKPLYDGAQPSGNSVTAMNLLRLAELTSDTAYVKRAEAIFKAFGDALKRGAVECPKLALALDFYLDRVKQVVVVEEADGSGAALVDVVRRSFIPSRVLAKTIATRVDSDATVVPLLESKRVMGSGTATGYVCFDQTCKKPTADAAEFRQQLDEVVAIQAPGLTVE